MVGYVEEERQNTEKESSATRGQGRVCPADEKSTVVEGHPFFFFSLRISKVQHTYLSLSLSLSLSRQTVMIRDSSTIVSQ